MTKEDILELYEDDDYVSMTSFKRFLDSNVVIPRGESRRPYADVLHAHIEGAEIQKLDEHIMLMSMPPQQKWDDISLPVGTYRLKPSESVFEYRYVIELDKLGYGYSDTFDFNCKYMTQQEADALIISTSNFVRAIKIEETKRVRQ